MEGPIELKIGSQILKICPYSTFLPFLSEKKSILEKQILWLKCCQVIKKCEKFSPPFHLCIYDTKVSFHHIASLQFNFSNVFNFKAPVQSSSFTWIYSKGSLKIMVNQVVFFLDNKSVQVWHFQEILSVNWVRKSVQIFERNYHRKNNTVRKQDNIEVLKKKKLFILGITFIFKKVKVVLISDNISK